jgi:NAD(P)-dependent dehydrogenase (short-subunit alcohol dehydrogenase family)
MSRIIVTGSEGLIGAGISSYLSEGGNSVLNIDVSLSEDMDLTNQDNVDRIFSSNKADYLVNLFGYNHHMDKGGSQKNTNFIDVKAEDIRKYHEINVEALFSVCKAFIDNADGVVGIINFGSLYSLNSPKAFLYTEPKHIGYVTSKHAVIGLTKYIATHCAPMVRANVICPGGIYNRNIDPDFLLTYVE